VSLYLYIASSFVIGVGVGFLVGGAVWAEEVDK
jgi:hypothetical protein